MTPEIALTLIVVVLTLVAFVREWAPPDVLALSVLCLVVALGLVGFQEMTLVFKNEAPLTIAVIARLGYDEKIPPSERAATASCVCLLLLQAAQAEGFGAQWLTGWAAYDPVVTARLGLQPNETVLGFIHLGTPSGEAPERQRPDPATLLSDWTP